MGQDTLVEEKNLKKKKEFTWYVGHCKSVSIEQGWGSIPVPLYWLEFLCSFSLRL